MILAGRMGCTVLVVSLDNTLNQAVAHNVVLVEINHGNSFDLTHDFDGFHQSRAARIRQVDLRDVSRDHRL